MGLIRVLGQRAVVVVRVQVREWRRRAAAGVGAITDLATVDALMGLPEGREVPWAGLSERAVRAVRRVGGGLVDVVGDGTVVRRATVPVEPVFALVRARDWRPGLRRAGRFAPFCARGMLLTSVPDVDELVLEAGFSGIGVFVDDQDGLRALVEPERYVRVRCSAAQWWFAETVFGQLS